MPFVFKRLALILSIAALAAAQSKPPKDAAAFKAGEAASFAAHQTNDKVTIGVEPYDHGDKVAVAFGKLNPYEYGILPVLVVIQNDSDKSIRLDHIKAEYSGPGSRDRVDATPAKDVRYLKSADRPLAMPGPGGRVKVLKTKNPLNAWEIEGRAFSAQMLPPGQSASGFFYFQTGLQKDATIYIAGLTEAQSGKELLFFELPLK